MGKTTLLLFVLVAGCHAAPCGGCADWETCDVAADACVLNANTRFDLVAVDGNVPGDSWDPLFGPPDPYLCASSSVMEECSSIQSDDATPKWNDTLLTGLDGTALVGAPLAVDYEDSDFDTPDLICRGVVAVSAAELHAGGFTFHCDNGAWARLSLHNTDRGTPAVAR